MEDELERLVEDRPARRFLAAVLSGRALPGPGWIYTFHALVSRRPPLHTATTAESAGYRCCIPRPPGGDANPLQMGGQSPRLALVS